MFKNRFSAFLLFVLIHLCSICYAQKLKLKTGSYTAYLELSSTHKLPVHLSIEKKKKKTILLLHNDQERIELTVTKVIGDTFVLPFPDFDSELRIIVNNKKNIRGNWYNYNKKGNYSIPFYAQLQPNEIPKQVKEQVTFEGRWETYFSEDKEVALGIFKQQGTNITGTFLTETGDYRYLQGKIENNSFYLSTFDGTHAFMITGSGNDSIIQGNFFSGKHYSTFYTAKKNDEFELRHPDSITVLNKNLPTFSFELQELNGNKYTFPNDQTKNKVVIIQLMGTWCPNCMDETIFYKELYEKYHSKGLEIVSIGYEVGDTFEQQRDKIQRLKERRALEFTFLVGGFASKKLASEQFSMLNEVISFPTSIYVGKDGEIKRIHTGFNGPGTGEYYEEYKKKTVSLIEELLNK
jgi:thiol-disulfide isomerase/thioredoxin